MKLFLTTLAFASLGVALLAQPNAPSSAPTERGWTIVTNETVDFDLKTRVAVYRGHVRIEDPTMTLTCAVLTAKVPESGGKMESIVAEQDVVIDATDDKGRVTHGTCDKLVYTYNVSGSVTNETVVLTGNPRLKNPMGNMTGDSIVWDKATGHVSAKNSKMEFKPGGTNSIPTLLKQPTGATK